MTVKSGFKQVMLNKMVARGIILTDKDKKNYTKAMKRFREETKCTKSFKPVLPYEQFKWW